MDGHFIAWGRIDLHKPVDHLAHARFAVATAMASTLKTRYGASSPHPPCASWCIRQTPCGSWRVEVDGERSVVPAATWTRLWTVQRQRHVAVVHALLVDRLAAQPLLAGSRRSAANGPGAIPRDDALPLVGTAALHQSNAAATRLTFETIVKPAPLTYGALSFDAYLIPVKMRPSCRSGTCTLSPSGFGRSLRPDYSDCTAAQPGICNRSELSHRGDAAFRIDCHHRACGRHCPR